MEKTGQETLEQKLDRLIEAISRLAPPAIRQPDFAAADCFVLSLIHISEPTRPY